VRAARTATTVLIAAALSLGAIGCGGSEVDYQEVPGQPADVSIPDDSSTLEGSGDSGASGDDASATPTPTPEDGTAVPEDQSGAAGTDTAAATQPTAPASDGTTDTGAGTDSGGSTAPAEPDGPSNDTAPPAGSEAEQFEAFCAENPGAC
jgi:hypothetical protein